MSIKLQLYRQKEKLKRRIHRNKFGYCTVLLYHRVIDLKYDPQLLCVSPDNFEKQLSALNKEGTFLHIDEFCDILTKGKVFPKNSYLITFDDGYSDNLHNAVPVLESLGLPSLFYIATAGIGTSDLMWWDELDLFFKGMKDPKDISELLKKYRFGDVASLYNHYISAFKTAASLKERNELLNEIRACGEIRKSDTHRMLTLDELKKLSGSKICTIGAHTVNHLSLGHLNSPDKKQEISGSIKWLEEKLNYKIKHFSFPYGEKINYDQETMELCKQMGMTSSAANYEGYVSAGTDLFSFPRFVVRNDGPDLLSQKLKRVIA